MCKGGWPIRGDTTDLDWDESRLFGFWERLYWSGRKSHRNYSGRVLLQSRFSKQGVHIPRLHHKYALLQAPDLLPLVLWVHKCFMCMLWAPIPRIWKSNWETWCMTRTHQINKGIHKICYYPAVWNMPRDIITGLLECWTSDKFICVLPCVIKNLRQSFMIWGISNYPLAMVPAFFYRANQWT